MQKNLNELMRLMPGKNRFKVGEEIRKRH